MLTRAGPELGPWFHRRPRLALVCSVVLFAVAGGVHAAAGDQADATTILLVFPIALIALALGLRAGLLASLASMAVMVGWGVAMGADVSAWGWVVRGVPLAVLGLLIGHASDVQRRSEAIASRLAIVEERQREAAEINDTIVQRLVAAKWSMELGDHHAGVEAIDDVIEASQGLVLDLLDGLALTTPERRRARTVAAEDVPVRSLTPGSVDR